MRSQQLERVANVFVGDWTVAITNQRWLDDNTATTTGMAKGAWLGDAFVELRVWLDGELAIERKDMNYRAADKDTLSGVTAAVHYTGPSAASGKSAKIWLTPFEVRWQ